MRNALTQRRATSLRSTLTESEQLLWRHLRRRQLNGLRFRRQAPIGPYIADFLCLEIRLVIEIDGAQHMFSEHDQVRDLYLRSNGFVVLRFWSHDVLRETQSVLEAIYRETKMPPP